MGNKDSDMNEIIETDLEKNIFPKPQQSDEVKSVKNKEMILAKKKQSEQSIVENIPSEKCEINKIKPEIPNVEKIYSELPHPKKGKLQNKSSHKREGQSKNKSAENLDIHKHSTDKYTQNVESDKWNSGNDQADQTMVA